MPEVKFTQEDLLERTKLAPGWRTLICKSVEEGPGKNDPSSIVYPCVFVVDGGPENGVPIRHWFSEKAPGRMVEYVECFVPNGKLEPGKVYELSQTVGKKIRGFCKFDQKQGYNIIDGWEPAGKSSNGQ
jgi:hypothetical protein